MAKRRVLSIATLYPNAAEPRFGTFVARSLEALAAHGGWEVTVINPIGVPPLRLGIYELLAEAAVCGIERGISVHRRLFGIIPGLSARWNAGSLAKAALPLARELHRDAPFDLVDAQFFHPDGAAAAAIAADLGLPLSIKARGADIQYWGRKPWCRNQMLAAAEAAAGLLAVSEALRDDMVALGMRRERIAVHYTGLDHARFRPLGREQCRVSLLDEYGIHLEADQYLLSSVGALIPRKGQQFVIAALPDLPGAVLALVGKGPDEAMLRGLAARLGVAGRVHFLGSLDHDALPVLLSASHAMVLPAASEGLANAWVEALACGAPLVIADAGGARELVKAPSAGRIVQRSAPAIAAAVNELIAAPPAPETVAANAAGFSWDAHAAELARYYESLIRDRPPL